MGCQQLHMAHRMGKRPQDSKYKNALPWWEHLFCTIRVAWLSFGAKIAVSYMVLHNLFFFRLPSARDVGKLKPLMGQIMVSWRNFPYTPEKTPRNQCVQLVPY